MKTPLGIALALSLVTFTGLTSAPPPDHIEIPTIWFKENSPRIVDDTAFYSIKDSAARPERMYGWLVEVLDENPTAVLGIYGYADGCESDPVELGLARCRSVRDSLTARGINTGRLILESKGESAPLINDEDLARIEDKQEMENLRQRNRRVELSIRSFDWKP